MNGNPFRSVAVRFYRQMPGRKRGIWSSGQLVNGAMKRPGGMEHRHITGMDYRAVLPLSDMNCR